MFVTLSTLDQLETFWREHKDKFKFACEGSGLDDPVFLREYEWVFGTSKATVVQTVMRWKKLGISCELYDWSKDEPIWWRSFFADRDLYRESQIKKGLWSNEDEGAYQTDCIRRSPETYRCFWQFKNLPALYSNDDWFSQTGEREELFDPKMPTEEVEQKLQEQTFDDWKDSNVEPIKYRDRTSIEEIIVYWRREKKDGQDYYGKENERGNKAPSP